MIAAQIELRKHASKKNVPILQNFFKTGPGQYGEGDVFIGVKNPSVRQVCKKYELLDFKSIQTLLKSSVHEDRLLGLLILVRQFEKQKILEEKEVLVKRYLSLKKGINNWDLVDVTAYKVVGEYCRLAKDVSILEKLSNSSRHWDKRMAMVGTFAFIRKGDVALTFQFAEKFLEESEDLMHKAAGWMLREAGKKDLQGLRAFIDKFGQEMPRTMLRYSIEKFEAKERKFILESTRKST